MARMNRRDVLADGEIQVVHCINRCVRRAFLCGNDVLTGQNFDHRREMIRDRLEFLVGIIGIEVLGYAVPNHVHLLAAFREEGMITRQGAAGRRYFASQINPLVGRSGHFWQEDQFDHLVRSEASFDRIRRYIIENPARAKLRVGDYRLFVSAET